jgi:NADP-dependent 3-hydroxy acid dehydrogenase YdfG
MTMFNASAPRLPTAPPEYDAAYLSQMLNILTLFFNQLNAVQPIMMAQLNIDLSTLPTEADLPTLRLGDVYRDTKDGVQATSQMLRIKTS